MDVVGRGVAGGDRFISRGSVKGSFEVEGGVDVANKVLVN